MAENPELALIRSARDGDARALEALVEEYQGVLYNLALRMTGSREDAQDLTQTVFLKVWRNLAINESLNFVQRRKRHSELDERITAGDPMPDEQASQGEVGQHIQEALMEL